ncbi:MAG: urease accessory protein UreF [Sphingobacteriia bacterium]|nr:urease accessory protein UreF [Sphingobacteriia bacterium]NCC40767.1 urease accessory protein UreF [Gammaproteobacteria bacterium]
MPSQAIEQTGDPLVLLRLMRLVSPALPIGAYAYSQGLESAVELGWVRTAEETRDWLDGLLSQSLTQLDLPVLARLQSATRQGETVARDAWNERLLAARETAELRFEDVQMGGALWRLLGDLGLATGLGPPRGDPSFASAFAAAGVAWSIPRETLLLAYAWCWLESQVGAATKLIPLGQTAAQRIIESLLPTLPAHVSMAGTLADDALGAALPGLAWLSARHETQYSRLFRS